ncbi:unnamed protein product, partial [Allacma fusca]
TSCEPIWDKALCWPRSESNVLNKHSCPAYIPGFNSKDHFLVPVKYPLSMWKTASKFIIIPSSPYERSAQLVV